MKYVEVAQVKKSENTSIIILFTLLKLIMFVNFSFKNVMELKLLSLLLFFILSFSSCEKENPEPLKPTYPIEGLWIGTYAVDALPQEGSTYFSFIIKPGGNLIVESHSQGSQLLATGTWILNADTLKCNYVYPSPVQGYPVTQTATAIYSNSGKLTSGIWKNVSAPGGTGKFTMDRVN
jgi:hypothetical protein